MVRSHMVKRFSRCSFQVEPKMCEFKLEGKKIISPLSSQFARIACAASVWFANTQGSDECLTFF